MGIREGNVNWEAGSGRGGCVDFEYLYNKDTRIQGYVTVSMCGLKVLERGNYFGENQ